MYQLSPYTYQMENTLGEMVLADLYNGQIYKVSQEHKKALKECLTHPNNASRLQKYFIKQDIFIEEEKLKLNRQKLLEEFSRGSELELILLPTERCNFRCSYCYEEYAKGAMSQEVQDGIVNYVEKHIEEYKSLVVSWFGGEPLCAINIVNNLSERLKQVCKKHKKIYFGMMTTNGYNLNLETFKVMLKRNRITEYQITIDGMKESHDKQRKLANNQGSFDTIINNLRDIRDNIKSHLFSISIRCNITKNLYHSFDEYVNFIEKEFGGDDRFNILWRIAWNPDDTQTNEEKAESIYANPMSLETILRNYQNRKDLRFEPDLLNFRRYGAICYASSKHSYTIGSDGHVYKCTVAFKDSKNHVGTLEKDGTMIIDKERFSFWTEQKPCTPIEKCEQCFRYPTCLGIYCPKNNQDTKGNFVCNRTAMAELPAYLEYYSKTLDLVEELDDLI